MLTFAEEIEGIRAREILLGGQYQLTLKPGDSLRVVLLIPYEHEYSLMCMGPLALYDAILSCSFLAGMITRRPRRGSGCLRLVSGTAACRFALLASSHGLAP
jgi:hypothetical protein